MPKTQSDKIAHPIAVVGFRQFPDQRLPLSEYYDPDPATPDKTYGTRGAFIDGFQFFS